MQEPVPEGTLNEQRPIAKNSYAWRKVEGNCVKKKEKIKFYYTGCDYIIVCCCELHYFAKGFVKFEELNVWSGVRGQLQVEYMQVVQLLERR